jgi:23S rRNA pseudouridine1911/1915/1917 synthase
MGLPPLHVLYEDNHLLVVAKPAGLPTMGVAPGKPSLLEQARQYVKQRYQKPGNVYLGVMSRLDAPVTGVVLLARTSKAARRLTEQFRTHAVRKTYWAVVEGDVTPAAAECVDWLSHDERHRRMHVVGPSFPGAQEARMAYRRLKPLGDLWLLELDLLTGRKHQIRLQLASRGWPVVGDRKYGSRRPFPGGIALHARNLSIRHPTTEGLLEFQAPVPATWRAFGLSG